MLKFVDITDENKDILNIQFLKPNQTGFADEPIDTIVIAKKIKNARPIAIYDDHDLVAFLVYELVAASNNSYLVWDFVVESSMQGKRYGLLIMRKLIGFLKEKKGAKRIELAIIPENKVAESLYIKLGFKRNGSLNKDGEIEMVLETLASF